MTKKEFTKITAELKRATELLSSVPTINSSYYNQFVTTTSEMSSLSASVVPMLRQCEVNTKPLIAAFKSLSKQMTPITATAVSANLNVVNHLKEMNKPASIIAKMINNEILDTFKTKTFIDNEDILNEDVDTISPYSDDVIHIKKESNDEFDVHIKLSESQLHNVIIKKSLPLFHDKHYEHSVFVAYKFIEIRIREKIGAKPQEYGANLIKKAFNPDNGLLTDNDLPKSERAALCKYIEGVYGYYKNPSSHREIKMNSSEAMDKLLVANDIHKIIDRSKKHIYN